MASTKNTTAQMAQRAKQERLRENQRRCRARRQEYLVQLEQRLEECRVTCREADFLRQGFQELQTENQHLRGLLNNVGLGPAHVDSFLHHRSRQGSSQPNKSTPASKNLRLLKPKIAPHSSPSGDKQTCHPSSYQIPVTVSIAQSNGSKPQAAVSSPSSCCPPISQTSSTLTPASGPLDASDFLKHPALQRALIDDIELILPPSSGDTSARDWLFNVSESTWEDYVVHSAEPFIRESLESNDSNP